MSDVKSIFGEFENPNASNEEKVIKDYCNEFVEHHQYFVEILIYENIIDKDHKFYSPLALYFIIDNDLEKNSSKIITTSHKESQ